MGDGYKRLIAALRGAKDATYDAGAAFRESLGGAPGTPWAEGLNSASAALRSMVPGNGTYEDELRQIRAQREQSNPGAYSVIDEVRRPARYAANEADMMGQGVGMVGALKVSPAELMARRTYLNNAARLAHSATDIGAQDVARGVNQEAIRGAEGHLAKRLREFGEAFDEKGIEPADVPYLRTLDALRPYGAMLEDKAALEMARLRAKALRGAGTVESTPATGTAAGRPSRMGR